MIKPQVAKRLEQCLDQDFDSRDCRVTSPHITARESIELADYIAALEAERDAALAQVDQLQHRVKDLQNANKLASQCLVKRDAEIAAKAVEAFGNWMLKNKRYNLGVQLCEQYANQLRQQAGVQK